MSMKFCKVKVIRGNKAAGKPEKTREELAILIKTMRSTRYACAHLKTLLGECGIYNGHTQVAYNHLIEPIKQIRKDIAIPKAQAIETIKLTMEHHLSHLVVKKGAFEIAVNVTNNMDIVKAIKTFKESVSTQIKTYRAIKRSMIQQPKTYVPKGWTDNLEYSVVGGTFAVKDSINKLAKQKQLKEAFLDKRPTDKDKHVGIEIEFYCKKNKKELAVYFLDAGLMKYITIKDDGSIHPEKAGFHSHEICVVCKETEYKDIVEKIGEILNLLEVDGQVNKTCGLHVHLDMRDRDKDKCFANLVQAQPILFQIVPENRRTNRFCKKAENKVFKDAVAAPSGDARYRAINPHSYSRHGTLEIRLHSGSVNPIKINNWIELLLLIVNNTTEVTKGATTIKGFAKQYEVPKHLMEYMEVRSVKFANGKGRDGKEIPSEVLEEQVA